MHSNLATIINYVVGCRLPLFLFHHSKIVHTYRKHRNMIGNVIKGILVMETNTWFVIFTINVDLRSSVFLFAIQPTVVTLSLSAQW